MDDVQNGYKTVPKKDNMKTLTLILLIFCINMQGQVHNSIYNYSFDDCGHWEVDSVYYTKWQTIDTINYNEYGDKVWIYDDWKREINVTTPGVFCPCGCKWDDREYQKRVCGLGIIQRKWKITVYKYIPKPKNSFDRRVDELNNNQ